MKKLFSALMVSLLVLSLTIAFANETIVIGATPTPHAEVLELIKDDLAVLGYDLQIQVFTDYYLPNDATAAGELDANYFQHIPFLSMFNADKSEEKQLLAAIPVHYEPYGIYAGTKSSLDDIEKGDSIAVMDDPANETRALLLLQEAGLITLPEGANTDTTLTKVDIIENPLGLEIFEMAAELIPAARGDVSYAIINGNYAIGAGLKPGEDALRLEDPQGESGKIYTNYVVVRSGDKDASWVEALRTVLQSDKVRDYMNTNEDYAKGVIPVF